MNPRLALATLCIFSATLDAQAPSPLSFISPPGGVDRTKLIGRSSGTTDSRMVAYRDGSYLAAWSPITNSWSELTVSFGTSPRLARDVLAIPEADRWTALSAYRGVFDVLLVDPNSTTFSLSDSMAWVRDGDTAHVFSAFTGRWHTHNVPASWVPTVSDGLLLFHQTTPTFAGATAFDGLSGTWHELAGGPGSAVVSQSGASALISILDGSTVEAATYTNGQNGWLRQTVVAAPGVTPVEMGRAGDLVAARDTVYSGLRRTLHSAPVPFLGPFAAPDVRGQIAFADTLQGTYVLAASGGGWQPFPVEVVPIDVGGPFVGQLFTATRLYRANDGQTFAFDAIQRTLIPSPVTSTPWFSSSRNGNLVGIVEDSAVAFYSAVTGQWHTTPSVPAGSFITATDTNALSLGSTGWVAFSTRSGRFVPLTAPSTLQGFGSWVRDSNTLHCFDPRTDRWLSAPLGTTPIQRFDAANAIAATGNTVLSWSQRTASLVTNTTNSTVLGAYLTRGGAVARTADRLYAISHLPSNLVVEGFPYDTFACGPGKTCHHQLRLPEGSGAIVAMSTFRQTPIPLPGWGDLWLEPASVVLSEFVAPRAGAHRARLPIPVPDVPSLQGTEWALQSLILPPQGTPYLTDTSTFIML